MSVFFQGRLLTQPQVATFINDSALQGTIQVGGSSTLAILGPAWQGAPNTPTAFNSIQSFQNYFGTTSAITIAAQRAFSPSPQTGGPPIVYGVRTTAHSTPATQAVAHLVKTSTNVIKLTSADYGSYVNTQKAGIFPLPGSVVAGQSNAGSWNQSAFVPYSAVQPQSQNSLYTITGSNIGYNALTITYGLDPVSTSANNAAYSITAGPSGNIQFFQPAAGGSSADAFTLSFATYTTLASLITAIQAQAGTLWQVTFPINPNNNFNGANMNTSFPTAKLDPVTKTYLDFSLCPDQVSHLAFSVINTTAINQAVIDWFNGSASSMWTAAEEASPSYLVVTGDSVWHYPTTLGTDGVATAASDYVDALDALQAVDAGVISAVLDPTNSGMYTNSIMQSIAIYVDQHCTMMSLGSYGTQSPRIQVTGPKAGTDLPTAISFAQAINSYRTAVVWPGVQDYNANQVLTTFDPFFVATQLGGMLTNQPAAQALTHQYINGQSLEYLPTWSTPTVNSTHTLLSQDIDSCLSAGVLPIQFIVSQGVRIVQSILAYNGDQLVDHHEVSVRRAADTIVQTISSYLDQLFIGQLITGNLLNSICIEVDNILSQYTTMGWLAGSSTAPAYQNIQAQSVTGTPTAVAVSFECSIAVPANYILLTAFLVPFSGGVSQQQ